MAQEESMSNQDVHVQEQPQVETGREPVPAPETHGRAHGGKASGRYLAALAHGALGVVYGDIGTSPLYAMRESFHGAHAIAATPLHIYGVLSLVFWSLIIVITIKYIGFIMRADNRGEGG